MEPGKIKKLHCLTHEDPPQQLHCSSPSPKPNTFLNYLNMQPHTLPHAILAQNPADFSTFCFLSNSQTHVPIQEFSPNTSSLSNDTTFVEARGHQLSLINERRVRRMISNRESARRSRMRKKKLIEELQFQVDQLQTMNHQLSEKLIHLLECNHQILQENAQLKEKVSSLQVILSDLFTPPLRNPEEVASITNRVRAEASNRSNNH